MQQFCECAEANAGPKVTYRTEENLPLPAKEYFEWVLVNAKEKLNNVAQQLDSSNALPDINSCFRRLYRFYAHNCAL